MRTLLMGLLVLGTAATVLAADLPVKVFVNGEQQSYNPPAVMRAGTVYVPLRAGAQSLGLSVKWHADLKAAQICTATGCVLIRQSEGIMVKGSLLLPLRKMGESTGAKVGWNSLQKAVVIQAKPHS
jgi:hypothetical protein